MRATMRGRMHPRVLFFVALLGFAFALTPASAFAADQGEVAARERRAREHFDEGVKLYDAKPPDYAGALSEFEAAMRDKPSWIIEQNIALALRALRRYPEALDALEETLRIGGADVKADARAQILTAITDLSPLIAELHVTVRAKGGPAPDGIALVVDGVRQRLENGQVTLRVGVGEHTVEVLSPHVAKKDRVRVAGRERAEVVVLVPSGAGTLVVNAEPGDRVVMQGVTRGVGRTTVSLPPGPARVEVLRATGSTFADSVTVVEDEAVTLDVPRAHGAAETDLGQADADPRRKDRRWLIEAGGAGMYTNLRLGGPLGETTEGKNRTLYGGSFLLRAGRRITSTLGIGLATELGSLTTFDYPSPIGKGATASTRLDTWAFGGGLFFMTPGDLSFGADATISFLGQEATTSLGDPSKANDSRHASGVGAALTADAGARYVWDRVTVGAFLFGTLHGVGAVLDANDSRALLDEPGFRVGARVLVGVRL